MLEQSERTITFRMTLNASSASSVGLTPCEIKTLQAAVDIEDANGMAEEMGVSKRTIDFHLHNAFGKLGVRSKHRAIIECLRAGLIQL